MTDLNYGFNGYAAPVGLTVQDNVNRALDYQYTHSDSETWDWFYEQVRNNADGHLPWNVSMDYKQLGREFADFGNFNFGVVGKALGYPDWVLLRGAGWAQGKADGLSTKDAIIRSLLK